MQKTIRNYHSRFHNGHGTCTPHWPMTATLVNEFLIHNARIHTIIKSLHQNSHNTHQLFIRQHKTTDNETQRAAQWDQAASEISKAGKSKQETNIPLGKLAMQE